MASLREEAKWYFDDFQNACCWMLVWKEGRSWNIESMYETEYIEGNYMLHRPSRWKISAEDKAELERVLAIDPKATIINGYYDNIGSLEEMTLSSLVDGIRYQYEHSNEDIEYILQVAQVAA